MTVTHHNIDELESIRLAQHLEELENRLISEYGASSEVSEGDIVWLFEEATKHFDTASVHVFLPILIERRIRAALELLRRTRAFSGKPRFGTTTRAVGS